MFISYIELWSIIIIGCIAYIGLIAAAAAVITTSLLAKGKIDSGATPEGDISPDQSRHNLTRASEYVGIIAGIGALGLLISVLTAVGLLFGG